MPRIGLAAGHSEKGDMIPLQISIHCYGEDKWLCKCANIKTAMNGKDQWLCKYGVKTFLLDMCCLPL